MSWREEEVEDNVVYKVVVNEEKQYSIWPNERDLPLGWSEAGKVGDKVECLAYIKATWVDMRPLSLQRKMAKDARCGESEAIRQQG